MDLGDTSVGGIPSFEGYEFRWPPVLMPYDVRKKIIVSTDASNRWLGAVMTQIQMEKTQRLVAEASRPLTASKEGYVVIEKEALEVT